MEYGDHNGYYEQRDHKRGVQDYIEVGKLGMTRERKDKDKEEELIKRTRIRLD
jgi:hypothetical protein